MRTSGASAVPYIRPISDLRTDLNDVCDMARTCREPIFMTKNGKASLVVMDCEAYEDQRQHDRYAMKLREAEIEARYRKDFVSQNQLDATLQKVFDAWGV